MNFKRYQFLEDNTKKFIENKIIDVIALASKEINIRINLLSDYVKIPAAIGRLTYDFVYASPAYPKLLSDNVQLPEEINRLAINYKLRVSGEVSRIS